MKKPHKIIPALLLSGAISFAAMAVPAKQGVMTIPQADGTTLKVKIVGDEWNHCYMTEDGHPLSEDGGTFRYVKADADGKLLLSPMKAADAAHRSAEAKAWLSDTDNHAVMRAMENARGSRRTMPDIRRDIPARSPGLFSEAKFPSKGKQKAIVVLVEYQDVKFTHPDPHDYFNRMLNEKGFADYGGTGSARDFFMESSQGQFAPEFDLYGPITLSRNMSFYGGNKSNGDDANPHWMVIEACQQLDGAVDFKEYDRNGDGYIDNVFVFYAGRGENSGGGTNTVWPHSYNVTAAEGTPFVFDGVTLDYYACSNEWEGNRPDGVGTFCHEFGHVLGLPDLYATSYTGAFTPGEWSVMDHGSYNNDGCTPPLYSAFERYALGWISPRQLTGPANITLRDISTNNACIIKTTDEDEFYLFENRQQQGWDTYIPGHGMLAWHIHYDRTVWMRNTCNNSPSHQYIDIVEADNTLSTSTRDGDSFPGTANVREFGDDTRPAMSTWCGFKPGLPLTEITEKGGVITFKVAGGVEPLPDVVMHEASAITPVGFTASWEPVAGAESYELEVYTVTHSPDGRTVITYADGFNPCNTGNATSHEVTGLRPATGYRFRVTAVSSDSSSLPSQEMTVTTGDPTFEYLSPLATEATEITPTSFTANWEAFDGAAGYLIEVYTKALGEPEMSLADFTGGIGAMPSGWATDCNMPLQNAAYAGGAIPSLWMRNDGNYLDTPVFPHPLRAISFWHRGIAADGANRLTVKALVNSEWVEVKSIPISNAAGGVTTTIDDLPSSATAARISYSRQASGTVAIDDVKAMHGGKETIGMVSGYDRLPVGNNTATGVKGLLPNTTYHYRLTAVNADNLHSCPSNEITVTTPDTNGIETAEALPGAEISASGTTITISTAGNAVGDFSVTDIAGRTVAKGCGNTASVSVSVHSPGIYIVAAMNTVKKIATK